MNSREQQRNNSQANESSQAPDPQTEEQLLELVLNETLSTANQQAVFPVVVNFAKRNLNRKITEPVVAEALIQEILEKRLNQTVIPGDCLQWVAETILNDPDACERLTSLWDTAKNECQ